MAVGVLFQRMGRLPETILLAGSSSKNFRVIATEWINGWLFSARSCAPSIDLGSCSRSKAPVEISWIPYLSRGGFIAAMDMRHSWRGSHLDAVIESWKHEKERIYRCAE